MSYRPHFLLSYCVTEVYSNQKTNLSKPFRRLVPVPVPVTLRNLSHLGTGTELSRKVFNPLDKDDQLELEHAIAVNAFNDRLVELMNFSLRLELFFGAKWFWGILGPSVQFEVECQ